MELIFLSEQDLTILDHAYATDDYDIIFDALVPQKSSFVVNKQVLNCGIGDLLITRDNGYGYVGIITAIEKDDKNRNKVKTKDFLSLFDVLWIPAFNLVYHPLSPLPFNLSSFLSHL